MSITHLNELVSWNGTMVVSMYVYSHSSSCANIQDSLCPVSKRSGGTSHAYIYTLGLSNGAMYRFPPRSIR